MTVTIYHNPACGTSRNVLGLIRNGGEEPAVIEYLKTPPSREELADLIRRMGVPVRDVLRRKGPPPTTSGSTTRISPTSSCSKHAQFQESGTYWCELPAEAATFLETRHQSRR